MTLFLYVGCGNPTGDIHHLRFDEATGSLREEARTASGSSASFATLHPAGHTLYLAHNRTDALSAFAVDPGSGALEPRGEVPVSGTRGQPIAGPAYVAVDRRGRFLLSANYRGHNVQVHALEADGAIGPLVCDRSDGEHAHFIETDVSNRFAFTPYLGSDRVAQYLFDETTGLLTPNAPAALPTGPGEGPRHLAFHPNGHSIYLVTELGSSLETLAFDGTHGTLTERQRLSAVRPGYAGRKWSSGVQVSPSGRHVYVANRAEETLGVFAVDPTDGTLRPERHVDLPGKTPRALVLDPTGRFLFVALQDSNLLAAFSVEDATGALALQGVFATSPSPYFALPLAAL